MATGPQIVHKQFNSPIGLYSQKNIQETLSKHIQNLDNGTMGIDFNNPTTDKPTNLANSAVLRMLEEEERVRRGYPSQKKVVWPPVPETNGYHQPQHQQQAPAYYNNAAHSPPATQHYPPQNQFHQQTPVQQNQLQSPAHSEGKRQAATGLSRLIPVGPGVTAAPVRAAPLSPASLQRQQQSRWAPVAAPLSPQAYGTQPAYPAPQASYPSQPQYSPQPQYNQEPQYQQRQYEPPATTITLRPQQPVHQKPPPVYASQPATASFHGGVNMRGDQKWPPQSVREAVAAENEARRMLAKGPACRPRKVKKDYSSFFAKHALTNNYPGYRAPPGTQHYEDYSGQSSY